MPKLVLNFDRTEHNDFAISIAKEVVENLKSGEYDDSSISMSEKLDSEISDVLETRLIYNDDRWDMMKLYLNPDDANYKEALGMCMEELYSMIKIVE